MADEDADLVLWGPSAAGKSMLVAQLFLSQHEDRSGWEILPTKDSATFVSDMRRVIRGQNEFPKATLRGAAQPIRYRFRHGVTGTEAVLVVEDRAGGDWEAMDPDAHARLQKAKGIVLLFDPTRDRSQVEQEVLGTLERLYVDLGETGKDPRPVAVCLSKADLLIRSPAEYTKACGADTMHAFAAGFLDAPVLKAFAKHCGCYRFFPISSAGLRLRWGQIEPFAFMDEELRWRLRSGGTPLNLMAPFAWLFDLVRPK